jgi:hypothetical protein
MSKHSYTSEQFEIATKIFGHFLGIDLKTESELLHIAANGLTDLPDGWELGIVEDGIAND